MMFALDPRGAKALDEAYITVGYAHSESSEGVAKIDSAALVLSETGRFTFFPDPKIKLRYDSLPERS